MRKILLLLLLPLSIFAKAPTSIMAPTVYDLTGVITADQQVVSLITDDARMVEFELDSESMYLTIPKAARFYYAAVVDAYDNLTYLYLGPKTVGGDEPRIQEYQAPITPVRAGLKAAGKWSLISLGSGGGVMLGGLAYVSTDLFTGLLIMVLGAAIIVYGVMASAVWGLIKGVQTAAYQGMQKRRSDQYAQLSSGSTTFVVEPVELEQIPKELRVPLLKNQRWL